MMNVVDIPDNINDRSLTADLAEDDTAEIKSFDEARVQKAVTENVS